MGSAPEARIFYGYFLDDLDIDGYARELRRTPCP